MTTNGHKTPEDKMVLVMERIAMYLERLLSATYWCAGFLAAIVFLLTLRLMIGR